MHLRNGWMWALVALAVCWLFFFQELSGEWKINPQYNYGYVVPLLGLALFWRRWPDRPKLRPPATPRPVGLAAAGLLLLLLPLRFVLEANPEWRLMYWLHGAQVVLLSLCLVYHMGGWPWVTHFMAPVLFMLIATPWPMELEQWAVQGLMRFVAGLTVSVADWLCPPAMQHGNLIEVSTGVVGIDEACSGVRSLQTAFMLSLFLGEMHRFRPVRRVVLVGASFLCVLVANLTRTTFLVWAANTRGMAQMEAWHDTAGVLVMLVVLPCLLGLAYLMKPKETVVAPTPLGSPWVLPSMPCWIGIAVLVWAGAAELAKETWYRLHEGNLVPSVRWSVTWPSTNPDFKKKAIPETALAILRCSNSESASWQDADGNRWSGFLLRWGPSKNSAQLAKGHRPDICLPAAGARLAQDFGQIPVTANGIVLPFSHQAFETGGGLVHTFYCLWEDRTRGDEKPLTGENSRASRMRAVLAGRRHLGQQVLEIVIQGPDSSDEALSLLKTELPHLIRQD